MGADDYLRVQGAQRHPGRIRFFDPHSGGGVQDLPLQVGDVHPVVVRQPDGSHPGRGQIKGGGRPQPPRPDHQHPGPPQTFLSLRPHFGQGQMTGVAARLPSPGGGPGVVRDHPRKTPGPPSAETIRQGKHLAVAHSFQGGRGQGGAFARRAVKHDRPVALPAGGGDAPLQDAAGNVHGGGNHPLRQFVPLPHIDQGNVGVAALGQLPGGDLLDFPQGGRHQIRVGGCHRRRLPANRRGRNRGSPGPGPIFSRAGRFPRGRPRRRLSRPRRRWGSSPAPTAGSRCAWSR